MGFMPDIRYTIGDSLTGRIGKFSRLQIVKRLSPDGNFGLGGSD
jgi:hypothetical protein